MLVFVLNHHGKPLMPCKPRKARLLLKEGKAKVIRKDPFTIKLYYGSSGYKQEVTASIDTGSKKIGCAATANNKVIYQSEIELRDDVSRKMQQRKMYRRTRRGRKTRYRKPRFNNRGKEGKLAPSIKSKIDSHFREKRFVESILPVTKWKVELTSFDIHKITNPKVEGEGYQEGNQKGFYNVKAYVLHRDNYTCQNCKGKSHERKVSEALTPRKKLCVHHIRFRSEKGTDTPSNLITLCKKCHADVHDGRIEFKSKSSKTKPATEMGIIKSQLKKSNAEGLQMETHCAPHGTAWEFEETFGYETKFKREQVLQLPKTHYYDAVAICCDDGEIVKPNDTVYFKKHVSKGDYKQTRGKRSEVRIPTGKLFGLRKFDLVKTSKGTGFVKGKRTSGFFCISNISADVLSASVNVKKNCVRLQARTTTLTERFVLSRRSRIERKATSSPD
ncbi:MAG: HNH endonuclease [Chloroflexi bacterium]|nr:HNH endonuclease [Chloroflexota bacterium]